MVEFFVSVIPEDTAAAIGSCAMIYAGLTPIVRSPEELEEMVRLSANILVFV